MNAGAILGELRCRQRRTIRARDACHGFGIRRDRRRKFPERVARKLLIADLSPGEFRGRRGSSRMTARDRREFRASRWPCGLSLNFAS